ncbi:Fic family protein [Bifidobacterium bifidum]|uniref:Fic family protein n=1 Tax=Bifidobacterium bifidum TaxID=1681 RepID=UPI0012ABB018|nr:Fic/DOC family N-terminal domain-containing protein [Bifidobacterium bifidum]
MFAPDAPGELGEDLPNPDMLRRPTMRREAQSTSALEGTFEPLETVLAQDYEVGEDKSGLSESMREVLNYLDAAECGIGQIQSGHPISLPLVRELQKLLVKGTKSGNPQAGDIRSTQVFIGSPTRRIEDARFVTMPPGRIGRLLVLLQMMSRGLLSQPLLSVSPWFERRRPEYQDRLLGVSTKGDWDNWILFFCQDIEESCEDALLRVKRLVNVRQRYRSLLDEHRYSGLSVQTAMYLIGQPIVTASMLRRRFGKSPSAVQHALSRLVSVGILRAYPAGRGNLYIAPDIHKVLAAPLGAAIDVSAPLMCECGE